MSDPVQPDSHLGGESGLADLRPSQGILLVTDVATLWGVSRRTVLAALDHGRRPGGRYAHDPVPEPDGYLGEGMRGNRPWWRAERAAELVAWHERLPGRGVKPYRSTP